MPGDEMEAATLKALQAISSGIETVVNRTEALAASVHTQGELLIRMDQRDRTGGKSGGGFATGVWQLGAFVMMAVGLLFTGLYVQQGAQALHMKEVSSLRAEFTAKQLVGLDDKLQEEIGSVAKDFQAAETGSRSRHMEQAHLIEALTAAIGWLENQIGGLDTLAALNAQSIGRQEAAITMAHPGS